MINYQLKNFSIKKIIWKTELFVAKNILTSLILIFLINLGIVGFFYYKYQSNLKTIEKESLQNPFIFEKSNYEKIVKILEEEKEKLNQADYASIINIFFNKNNTQEPTKENLTKQ